MGVTITRGNFFSETVAHPGGAITLAALKRIAGWGFVKDSNNIPTAQKSADSFTSDGATIIPTADCYVGHDEFVAAAAAAGPPVLYKGVLAAAGDPFNLNDYCRGIVADDDVYIFSTAGQEIQVITLGV